MAIRPISLPTTGTNPKNILTADFEGEVNASLTQVYVDFDAASDATTAALAEKADTAGNVLWDAWNEHTSLDADFGGWDWRAGGWDYNAVGTPNVYTTSDANLPTNGTAKIVSGAGSEDKYWPVEYLGLVAGEEITISALIHAATTGARVVVHFRNSGGTLVSNAASANSTVTGVQTLSLTMNVPAVETERLMIRVESLSGAFEIGAYSVARGSVPATFKSAPLPLPFVGAGQSVSNRLADPFSQTVNAATGADPFSRQDALFGTYYTASVNSPWGASSLAGSSGTALLRRYIDLAEIDIRPGQDRVRVRVAAHFASAGGNIGVFVRTAANTVVRTQTLSASGSGYFEAITSLLDTTGAEHILVTVNGAMDRELLAISVSDSVAVPTFAPPVPVKFHNANATPEFMWGQWFLRETRQRTRRLSYGDSEQFTIACIGDSWTHFAARYTGPVASILRDTFGASGAGWLGFSWPSSNTALLNGNVLPSVYGYTEPTGTWATNYRTSISPDICSITSSTAASLITVTGDSSPVVSGVDLYHVGTADGVVRYRWNAGAWTSLNVQGTVGDLQWQALSGVPSSGAWTLEIEVVSGTVEVCGLDIKSAADGVTVHKLGATGSRAEEWVAVNAADWQSGLANLAPNLVTIMHGTNDQGAGRSVAEFSSDIGTLIDRVRAALPSADILVVMPCENQRGLPDAMSEYADAVYAVCASKRVAFMNLQAVFGDDPADYAAGSDRPWFNADQTHPDPTTGGRAIVDAVFKILTQ